MPTFNVDVFLKNALGITHTPKIAKFKEDAKNVIIKRRDYGVHWKNGSKIR